MQELKADVVGLMDGVLDGLKEDLETQARAGRDEAERHRRNQSPLPRKKGKTCL